MEQEKQIFNLAEGVSEVIIRQGEAPKVLNPQPPVAYDVDGQIGSISEFLSKRLDKGQFEPKDCSIIVDRKGLAVVLVFNERDAYNRGRINSGISIHPDFAILHINERYAWTPIELAMLLKMHRHWFANRADGMKLVTTLMNYKADIAQKVEQSAEANGNRGDVFTQVVNSNLPASVILQLPVFKGQKPQPVEVEFFANVDGRDVKFLLLSPGANEILEEFRDKAIDEELAKIREIAPDIVIIEQ